MKYMISVIQNLKSIKMIW